ncbi:MAG: hypothetical protein C4523_04475 [Myxococcales bacterium]|nr:MAG: hypothetical protein C4523_04475 [Myxococcales bacterium]
MRAIQTAIVLLSILTMIVFAPAAYAEESCLGFKVPGSAKRVEANRFKLTHSWDEAKRFYKKAYPKGVERTTTIALPNVRSMHFSNLEGKGRWAGANMSLIRNQVYVFCYEQPREAGR